MDSPAGTPAGASRPLADAYAGTRRRTLALTQGLSAEDQQVQSMPDASPVKWHLAHTSWFFETFVLKPYLPGHAVFDERFGFLFNSYYDSLGERQARAGRGLMTRPSLEAVLAYRAHVDAGMARLLAQAPEDAVATLTALGLAHEEQHQELILMDIKHAFSLNPLDVAYRPAAPARAQRAGLAPAARWRTFEGGLVEIGRAPGDGFAFDMEGPRHRVWLEPFALCDRLVTCGEWLEFIADGGYGDPRLWLSDGWAAAQAEGWTAPAYWRRDDGGWSVFTLEGRRPVDPAEPVVHVSHFEADAFARWAGARLPLEAEWEHAAAGAGADACTPHDLHPRAPAHGGPDPVSGPISGDFFGAVWQWTASSYGPYPRYRPAPDATGEYNGKFMSGQRVLRGGACVTPPGHSRVTYRNFFPPAARWAFGGLRLARDA